ncbi:hypothetical protein VTK56DRAFT_9628 [Thermocarpiscus australiensis]
MRSMLPWLAHTLYLRFMVSRPNLPPARLQPGEKADSLDLDSSFVAERSFLIRYNLANSTEGPEASSASLGRSCSCYDGAVPGSSQQLVCILPLKALEQLSPTEPRYIRRVRPRLQLVRRSIPPINKWHTEFAVYGFQLHPESRTKPSSPGPQSCA